MLLTEEIKHSNEAWSQSTGDVLDCVTQGCHFAANYVCVCVGGWREEAWGGDKDSSKGKLYQVFGPNESRGLKSLPLKQQTHRESFHSSGTWRPAPEDFVYTVNVSKLK